MPRRHSTTRPSSHPIQAFSPTLKAVSSFGQRAKRLWVLVLSAALLSFAVHQLHQFRVELIHARD